jgi:hypothetical protein
MRCPLPLSASIYNIHQRIQKYLLSSIMTKFYNFFFLGTTFCLGCLVAVGIRHSFNSVAVVGDEHDGHAGNFSDATFQVLEEKEFLNEEVCVNISRLIQVEFCKPPLT